MYALAIDGKTAEQRQEFDAMLSGDDTNASIDVNDARSTILAMGGDVVIG